MQSIVNTISSYLPAQIVSNTEDITQVDEETIPSDKNDAEEQDLANSARKLDLSDKEVEDKSTDINKVNSRPDRIRYDSDQILNNAPGGTNDQSIIKGDTQDSSHLSSNLIVKESLLAEREDPTQYQTNALAHESTKKPIPATLDDPQAAMKEQLSENSHRTDQLRAPNAGLDVISGVANQPTVASSRAVNYADKDHHARFVVGNRASGTLDPGDSSFKIPSASIASDNDSSIQQGVAADNSADQKVKVPIGDKIAGSFEKMVEKMTKNEAKIEHGELKKTGQLQE